MKPPPPASLGQMKDTLFSLKQVLLHQRLPFKQQLLQHLCCMPLLLTYLVGVNLEQEHCPHSGVTEQIWPQDVWCLGAGRA